MKATITVEAIGDDQNQYFRLHRGILNDGMPGLGDKVLGDIKQRHWCARLTGLDPKYGFRREFVKGRKDYANANSVGSRGVMVWYILDPGVYEVSSPETWKRTRRYFLRVNYDGTTEEISREEVEQCLKPA